MIDRFISRFGKDKIAVLHSKLSIGERYDEWNKIKNGKIKIVIGVRSAIFAPIENLGIIIIDEEHDSSYNQNQTLNMMLNKLQDTYQNKHYVHLF